MRNNSDRQGGEILDKERYSLELKEEDRKVLQSGNHVGGVNESAGGVDPDIDENLMRLSGGP